VPAPRLNPAQIAAKCVEVEKSFLNIAPGFVQADLERTLEVGELARLAAAIRQAGLIEEERLKAISVATKIPYRDLRLIALPRIQKLGWGEIRSGQGGSTTFVESMPPSGEILSTLGRYWEDLGPNDVDRATVEGLSLLSRRPVARDALASELSQKQSVIDRALAYGDPVRYFGTFTSQAIGKIVAWTPLYWSKNEEEVRRFLSRQSEPGFDVLRKAMANVREYPGRPLDRLRPTIPNEGLVNGAIATGFLPSVQVKDRRKVAHSYVFSPSPTFSGDEGSDVFEKARMIVACIRHGQFDAEVSPIRMPSKLLRSIVSGTIGAHSYADVEYAMLVLHRICDLEEVSSYGLKRYRPVFIDTPENRQAVGVAQQLLGATGPDTSIVSEPEVKGLLTAGLYSYSSEERITRAKAKIVAYNEFERMMDSIRGGAVQ
jgi:hypothetical protein